MSSVKEVKTKLGNKVVLILNDEVQIFLLSNLQIFFLKETPDQLAALKARVHESNFVLVHTGNRKLKFIVPRDNPYYKELKF